tara:strand:- start:2689 stop:3282 length:594 start_codon:yes stop_codon:yes gene_type:complete
MGMDVYGLDPQVNTVDDSLFSVYLKYKDADFDDKWKELDKDEDLREKYWEQQRAFENLNPGSYFRNNVWWWRPLWHYVCDVCDDLLTEEDKKGCTDNSGYQINEDKALKIGIRLHSLVMDGSTQEWKEGYDKEVAALPKEPCFRCNGNNHGHTKKKDCHGCDKTGERDNWQASYPFDTENVRDFAKFCVESGGFEVC